MTAPPLRFSASRPIASPARACLTACACSRSQTPHLHTASVCLYVRAGSRYETPETNGLSHFLEHMLFRGSGRYPSSFALNLAIEELGGTLYAETGRDYSLYQISAAPEAGGARPGDPGRSVRDAGVPRHRPGTQDHRRGDPRGPRRSRPQRQRRRSVARGWRGAITRSGFPITGPMRNVRRFSLADVRAHFRRFYGAANMVLAVAGPLATRARARAGARGVRARARRDAARAAAAAPERRGPALPRHPQRIGADAGARAVSRAARDRSRATRRCAR